MNMKYVLAATVVAVLATCRVVAAGQVQLLNSGFEEPSIVGGGNAGDMPTNWFNFASGPGTAPGISQKKRRDGLQSCVLKCPESEDGYCGIAQRFRVAAGHRYVFSTYALNNVSGPIVGESFGQVSLEWQDVAGKEMGRTYGPSWNFQLSPLSWQRFQVDAVAPEGAFQGIAVVTFFGRDAMGKGSYFVDDLRLVEKGKINVQEQ